ncbi:MAG: C-GCAxxG-C-C family protein [Clostridia bacterium]|nr:C-GCAxxG-C-C family protein [Clostridia bacterium]
MTTEERAERAVALRAAHTHNCCQAVAAVLGEELGVNSELLYHIASGFGGGMGTMEGTCGALAAAAMAAGIATKGKAGPVYAGKIQKEFVNQTGALLCKDLKGRSTGRVLCPCEECVRCAVRSFDQIMQDNLGETHPSS